MTSIVLLLVACADPPDPARDVPPAPLEPPALPAPVDPAPPAPDPPEPASLRPEVPVRGASLPAATIEERLREGTPRSFRPLDRSGDQIDVAMEGDVHAVFVPRTHARPEGYMSEVAAYRIGRFLGLETVPPAVRRRFAATEIEQAMDPDGAIDWEGLRPLLAPDDEGSVPGSVRLWIPLVSLELERGREVRQWSRWLRQGEVYPPEQEPLLRDLSQMVVFDYLIANPTRMSPEHLRGFLDPPRVVLTRHAESFPSPVPTREHDLVLENLLRAQRFSRGLVERLQRLDDAALRATLEDDPDFASPLLDEAQIAEVLERRTGLLSYIGSLCDIHGEQSVLAFP